MMKRNGLPIEIIWLHMDAMHGSYAPAVNASRAQHEDRGSFMLSVNLKDDGTEALVKVVGVTTPWVTGKAWSGAILRVFTEADHDEAVTMVNAAAWTGA